MTETRRSLRSTRTEAAPEAQPGGVRAEPGGSPAVTVTAPTRSDPVVRSFSEVAGGPAGWLLARGAGAWSAVSVLVMLAALMMGASLAVHQHCRSNGWTNPDQFWHACYSDTAVLYSSGQLGGPDRPSLHEALGPGGLGQAPLQGAAMWLVSAPVQAIWGTDGESPSSTAVLRFFDISAVVLTLALFVAVIATAAAVGRRRAWDAAHLAVAPILLSVGLLSYELLGVAFVALALWAWSRRSPIWCGVFASAAISSRPVTALLLVALLALAVRARRTTAAAMAIAVAVAGWLALRLVLTGGLGLGAAWSQWRASGAGYGSLWLVPQLIEQSLGNASMSSPLRALSPTVVSFVALMALAAVVLVTAYLALTATYRPRVAHLALFAVALGLLSVKAFPPQASLVLLPLIAASSLKWRDHLIWATAEISYYVAVWLYIALGDAPELGLPAQFYLIFLLLRCAAVAWLAVQAWRMMRHPSLDPVRVPVDPLEDHDGDDDPTAGVLVSPSVSPSVSTSLRSSAGPG